MRTYYFTAEGLIDDEPFEFEVKARSTATAWRAAIERAIEIIEEQAVGDALHQLTLVHSTP